jgi:5-methyltetrahydrofolate--homocysteine methyltransferase
MSKEFQPLYDAILNGDAKTAKATTSAALAAGASAITLVQDYMVPAMTEAGSRFECNEYFVPDLLVSAQAMKGSMELLRPQLAASGAQSAGRVAIGTVKGDLHDIGKNLVAAMLEGGGFEVIDLGVNVSPQQFVEAVTVKQANLVAMSALLTTTMPAMKSTIDALNAAGVRNKVGVLVGGAPINQKFADEIGADGFCESAGAAAALARKTIAARK